MTRIYEALQEAAKERTDVGQVVQFPRIDTTSHDNQLCYKMTALYRVICAQCPNETGNVVQFLGTHKGAGASRLLRTLAKVVSGFLHKSVLIIDADPESPQVTHFSVTPRVSWSDAMREKRPINETLHRIGRSSLYLTQAYNGSGPTNVFVDSPYTEKKLDLLRTTFDLILVDTAAAGESSDSIALPKKVDGVVMIVEAEKTRWQVARDVKEEIEKQGGRILGVVLNGRRHHIPERIYNRL